MRFETLRAQVPAGNLAQLLDDAASRTGGSTAIISGDDVLSYDDVDRAANRLANLLERNGLGPGSRIALSCPNVPAFTVAYFAILKLGAIVVPLNVLLRSREIAYHLEDSGADAYLAHEGTPDDALGETAWAGFIASPRCRRFFLIDDDTLAGGPTELTTLTGLERRHAHALSPQVPGESETFASRPRDDDDTAVILYTSGTTGQPKGAELRHRNLRDNAVACCAVAEADPQRPDTYLAALPLFHSFGQTNIQNASVLMGGTVVMMRRFEPELAATLMFQHHVSFFAGVPTMFWALLGLDDAVTSGAAGSWGSALRIAVSGGAALPVDIHRRFREQHDITILEGYGLSETSPLATLARYGEEPRVGSIGVPVPGVELKLVADDWSEVGADEIGEIAIRGHNVMKGYFNRPDATAEAVVDGWFRTGDLARRDRDGFYYIVDRSKDMIIRGGFNVYPRELEEVLITHPAVSLVAVVGVPHESHGEEIKAVVVKNEGHEGVTPEDLVAWGREQLAAYKYPRIVEFVPDLPMTSTGKILKRELT